MRTGIRRTLRALGALALATAVAVPLAVTASEAEPAFAAATVCTSTPFRSSPSHHYWYRIPSLAKSNGSVVYAFAERRDNDTTDDGNFDISMVRSSNNGCTWTAPRVVFSHGSDRVSNPSAVVASNGRVYLFASARFKAAGTTAERNYLYVSNSSDSFGTEKLLNDFDYAGALTGPGGAITLQNGPHKGRMVVPMSASSNGRMGVYLLMSDDSGATWEPGRITWAPSGTHLIEPAVAERTSGGLLISLRDSQLVNGNYKSAGNTRYYAVSTDAGDTIGSIAKGHAPKIVSVQASMIVPTGTYKNDLFMVAPAQATPGRPDQRRDESIFMSATGGSTWHAAFHLESVNNPGAYSDITQLDSQTFGVLYEGGVRSYKEVIKYRSVRILTVVRN